MSLSDKHIAIVAEDNDPALELHDPRRRLIEAGARVSVRGAGKATHHSGKGCAVGVDASIEVLS